MGFNLYPWHFWGCWAGTWLRRRLLAIHSYALDLVLLLIFSFVHTKSEKEHPLISPIRFLSTATQSMGWWLLLPAGIIGVPHKYWRKHAELQPHLTVLNHQWRQHLHVWSNHWLSYSCEQKARYPDSSKLQLVRLVCLEMDECLNSTVARFSMGHGGRSLAAASSDFRAGPFLIPHLWRLGVARTWRKNGQWGKTLIYRLWDNLCTSPRAS